MSHEAASERSFSGRGSVASAGSASVDRHEGLTPRQFLERYSLPRAVRVVPQQPVAEDSADAGPAALLAGRLLLVKQYRAGKVEARSESTSRHGDLLSLVVIPDTYQGWFSVVTERGQIKARCYTSVHRLVSAQVTAFLSMTEIVGYTLNNRTSADGTRQQYSKSNIRSGQVLKLLAVYQDLADQSTRSKRLSWPLIGRTEANRYAQCLTATDQVLFIPVTTHGQFYAVATAAGAGDDTVSKVYQLPKLLRTFPLPVRVCIISSQKAQGSMLLETYKKEDVILACILPSREEETHRLLEIDVNSRFFVLRLGRRETDERRIFHSQPVQDAIRFCRENSDQWCRQLKVIHHIYPKEHLTQEKPKPRKISLGDKKTVKSASFRFSASMPEDLRPINRPLPRRPDQTEEEHVYSNVADEDSQRAPDLVKRSIRSQIETRSPPEPVNRSVRSQVDARTPVQAADRSQDETRSPPEPVSRSMRSQVEARTPVKSADRSQVETRSPPEPVSRSIRSQVDARAPVQAADRSQIETRSQPEPVSRSIRSQVDVRTPVKVAERSYRSQANTGSQPEPAVRTLISQLEAKSVVSKTNVEVVAAQLKTQVEVEVEVDDPRSLHAHVESEHQTVWASPMKNRSIASERSRPFQRLMPTPSLQSERLSESVRSDRLSEEFKTKIVVSGVRVPGFDENNYADRNAKYRVVRKPINAEVRVKPFYKTRVQIGQDYSGGSDAPYSVVADQVSIAEDNLYAEIGDTYPTHDRRYFSFNCRRLLNRYNYRTGGSDGTFSGTTTSSSNAEESSV